MLRRWRLAVLSVVCGVFVAATELTGGTLGAAAALLAFFLLLAFLVSPLFFPRPVTAAAAIASGRPVIYWRPGCPYCLRMRALLGPQASRLEWVDIWTDPEGAAVVRGNAGGNETVPTVVLAGESLVNPHPRLLRQRLKTL
jgi:mycoredoxin